MKKILFIILGSIFGIVLLAAESIGIASAASQKPVYATVAQVTQMISDATAPLQTTITSLTSRVETLENNQPEPQIVPDYSTSIISAEICQNENAADLQDQWRFGIKLDNTLNGQAFDSGIANWGVIHLPSGDILASGTNDLLFRGVIPTAQMPPVGTPVNADVYSFFAGKTNHLNINVDNWIGICPWMWPY